MLKNQGGQHNDEVTQGKGRRDEVGRSGVYPESGPHPSEPDAPMRTQGEWGSGPERERPGGAEGGQPGSPIRQPQGGENLDEEYEKNTKIKRETQFRDATAHPLDPNAGGPKVTKDNDQFKK